MWHSLTIYPLILYSYLIIITLSWTTIIMCHKTNKSENCVLKIVKKNYPNIFYGDTHFSLCIKITFLSSPANNITHAQHFHNNFILNTNTFQLWGIEYFDLFMNGFITSILEVLIIYFYYHY